MKTLKQLLSKTKQDTRNFASPKDGMDSFVAKHEVETVADAAGNGDDVFKASNVKTVDRSAERHGYDPKEDEKVHEETSLSEGEEAHSQFMKYHTETAKLLKDIHKGLSAHYDNVTSKNTYHNGMAHWGHVGDIKSIHRQLQDLHDFVLQQNDMTKPVSVKEESDLEEKTLTKAEMKKREEVAQAIERETPNMPMSKKMAIATATAKRVAEEVEETTLEEDMIELYFALDEETRDQFIAILESGAEEELLEFVEMLGEQNG